MITKKHYIKIAKLLNEFKDNQVVGKITDRLCIMFKDDNPQFDEERFKRAVFE